MSHKNQPCYILNDSANQVQHNNSCYTELTLKSSVISTCSYLKCLKQRTSWGFSQACTEANAQQLKGRFCQFRRTNTI